MGRWRGSTHVAGQFSEGLDENGQLNDHAIRIASEINRERYDVPTFDMKISRSIDHTFVIAFEWVLGRELIHSEAVSLGSLINAHVYEWGFDETKALLDLCRVRYRPAEIGCTWDEVKTVLARINELHDLLGNPPNWFHHRTLGDASVRADGRRHRRGLADGVQAVLAVPFVVSQSNHAPEASLRDALRQAQSERDLPLMTQSVVRVGLIGAGNFGGEVAKIVARRPGAGARRGVADVNADARAKSRRNVRHALLGRSPRLAGGVRLRRGGRRHAAQHAPGHRGGCGGRRGATSFAKRPWRSPWPSATT